MSVSADPQPFVIKTSTLESNPTVNSTSSFYNLTTNVENVLIQAELDLPMPAGLELWLSGESLLGQSHGLVQLDGSGIRPIVSGIQRGLENGRELTYQLIAAPFVKDIPFQSRTITLTLMDKVNSQQQQITQTLYFSSAIPSADAPNK